MFPLLFIINLLLIKEGKDFTGYRNMLFYTSDIDMLTPLIVFVFSYICILVYYQKINIEVPKDKLRIIILLLLLAFAPQIAFLNIPETNPDFIRYYQYSEILKNHGLLYYLGEWGTGFGAHVDLPMGSLPFGIIFSLFGSERIYIQIFMCLVLFLTSYIIFLLGSHMFNAKMGIISSVVFLSFPFMLSQVPLLLIDIISTLYITALAYVLYKYHDDERICFYLVMPATLLFIAFFSKILSLFFIVPIIMGIIIIHLFNLLSENKKSNRRPILFLSLSSSLVLSYMIIISDFYKITALNLLYSKTGINISNNYFEFTLIGVVVASLASVSILYKFFTYNLGWRIKTTAHNYKYPILIFIYVIIILAFISDFGNHFFYLRSLPNAVGIVPSILLFSSLALIVKNRETTKMLPIILWVFVPIFLLPHVMYKYLQPAYPAIALTCGYVIYNFKYDDIQRFVTLNVFISGLIIALLVFYPMSITHSQINVKETVEEMENLKIEEFDVVYLPEKPFFIESFRIHQFEVFAPVWVNYYSKSNIELNIITIQNNMEYKNYLRSIKQSEKPYIIIVTDQALIDERVLPPEILLNYSIYDIKNKGYHAAFWTSTRQVIILGKKESPIIIEDHGILDDKVYLTSLRYDRNDLKEFDSPIYIDLEFYEDSDNIFVIYDHYDGRFHRSGEIYLIGKNDTRSTYTITREPDRLLLHIHELKKQPLNLKKVKISNETELIAELTA